MTFEFVFPARKRVRGMPPDPGGVTGEAKTAAGNATSLEGKILIQHVPSLEPLPACALNMRHLMHIEANVIPI